MKKVVLSLGSNLLDRANNLLRARDLIKLRIGEIQAASRIDETVSWGFDSAPFFYFFLVVSTNLSPEEVLLVTQGIEKALGRTEKSGRDAAGNPVYHDRIIDIDILLFEGETRMSPELTIPHPHINKRKFVLEPLSELFGNQVIEPFNISFRQMLSKLS